MNKIVLLCLLISGLCFGQKVTVAALSIKLDGGQTEEVMYSFAAGDRIILTMEALGSPFGEVKVFQYHNDIPVYSGNAIKEEKKELPVVNTSVYVFKFKNTAVGKRGLAVTIQRIPKNSDTKSFNTAVKWVTVQDTVYIYETAQVLERYDTLYTAKKRRVVIAEKKYEELVLDKSQRVGARTSFDETTALVSFTMPVNTITADETKKVVAWAYWVGVGEESNEFWKQNRKMLVGAVQGAAGYFTTPLGGIAAGVVTNLILPVNGEDVAYALVNEANGRLFMAGKPYKAVDDGKGIAAYKRITDAGMLQGNFALGLANDNYVQPIDVNVKVAAIIEHIRYKEEKYIDATVTPIYKTKQLQKPQVTFKKMPVPFDSK